MCVTTCHMDDSYAVMATFAESHRPDRMPSLGDRILLPHRGFPAWGLGHVRIGMEQAAATRLLLVRHRQTHTSLDYAFCGVTEVPLTLNGLSQVQCLAERLRRELVDALYCSPQQRAQETAAPIGLALEMEIRTLNALHEMDFGEWENRLRADLAMEYPHELEE